MTLDKRSDKKKQFIVFIVLITVLVFFRELTAVLNGMDEIRNYNLSRGIVMGYVPYRDFNMVMVPLFNLIFALPLLISRSLLTFRITSAVFWVVTFAAFYKLCCRHTDHHVSVLICVVSVIFIHQYNYNTLVFLAAIFFMLIAEEELTFAKAVLMGIIGTLAALSRQTSGSVLLLMGIFIAVKEAASGKKVRMFISYVSGVGITGVLFLIYLLVTESFVQFWDYCLFALFLPGGNGSVLSSSSIAPLIISVAGVIADVIAFRKEKNMKRIYHMLLGGALITIAIPLVDHMHIVFAGFWFAVPVAEVLYGKVKRQLTGGSLTMLIAAAGVIVFMIGGLNLRDIRFTDKYREFKNIPMTASIEEGFGTLADENKRLESEGYHVTVFLHEAAMLSIMNEEFNPPYDLFLKGNIGTTDAQYYWDAALQQENAIILTSDEYYVSGWQSPDGTLEYIKDHCEPVEEFAQFTWYVPAEG